MNLLLYLVGLILICVLNAFRCKNEKQFQKECTKDLLIYSLVYLLSSLCG